MNRPVWRKSSRSGTGGTGGQDCVEVACLGDKRGIRDSKAPDAGHLCLLPTTFAAFIAHIKHETHSA